MSGDHINTKAMCDHISTTARKLQKGRTDSMDNSDEIFIDTPTSGPVYFPVNVVRRALAEHDERTGANRQPEQASETYPDSPTKNYPKVDYETRLVLIEALREVYDPDELRLFHTADLANRLVKWLDEVDRENDDLRQAKAAAPELLAACKGARDFIILTQGIEGPLYDQLREAIAKAEGK